MSKIFWIIFLCLYMLLIIIGAIIPNPNKIYGFGGFTNYYHFFGFFVLSMLIIKTLSVFRFKNIFLLTLMFGLIFAIFTELLQLLVPSRSFTHADIFIDIFGFVLGMVVYRWIFFKR